MTLMDEVRSFVRRPAIAAIATGLLAVDLGLSRIILLSKSRLDGATIVPGLLDFRFMWNRGISFSLFWQSSNFGSWVIAIFSAVVAVLLLRWAILSNKLLMSGALTCVAVGALGNVASRLLHGAVFDYFAFHVGEVPLFVFNISDVLISVGVIGLLVETTWPTRWTAQIGNTGHAED